MRRDELLVYLEEYLQIKSWPDMAVNGLQVEGRDCVEKIATGVSASVAFITEAIHQGADTLIVHHGIFWEKADPVVRGPLKMRLSLLIENNINLLAYHLPLDGHPVHGNNAVIARVLGFTDPEPAFPYHGSPPIGVMVNEAGLDVEDLKEKLVALVGDPVIHLNDGPEKINRIGIVSGGAQSEFLAAVVQGCDAFITGEISEYVVDLAKESKTHFFCCGHYRTETFGVKAVGDHLAEKHDLDVRFIHLPHPY